MKLQSFYPVICVENVEETADFYRNHLRFKTVFEADWYVHLQMECTETANLAIVDSKHSSVPEKYRKSAQGILLNFEMDDVDQIYAEFLDKKLTILRQLKDEEWGQRHFIASDPSGVMVDIIKLIEPSEEFKAQYVE